MHPYLSLCPARQQRSALLFVILVLTGILPAISDIHAATWFWDPSTTTGLNGGDGTWDLGGSNWSSTNNGATRTNWINGNSAYFGGVDAPSTFNVVVDTSGGAISTNTATSLTFVMAVTRALSLGNLRLASGGCLQNGNWRNDRRANQRSRQSGWSRQHGDFPSNALLLSPTTNAVAPPPVNELPHSADLEAPAGLGFDRAGVSLSPDSGWPRKSDSGFAGGPVYATQSSASGALCLGAGTGVIRAWKVLRNMHTKFLSILLAVMFWAGSPANSAPNPKIQVATPAVSTPSTVKSIEELAAKSNATENKAPEWIKHGTYVYRICTPDNAEFLPFTEAGLSITHHLLDDSVQQVPLINGLISDDHPGACNWDGIWPYWNRVSYRAKNWDYLRGFMQRVNEKSNTKISFHVNLTDVNVGMKAFPETREFFKKLIETKSIYCRDINKATNKRDLEPPYVPQDFPTDADSPTKIFALVNYKNFWDSGLAKQMIDEFYGHLPYAPPVLYVDVLTLEGGNFTTGYPTGPLGGSKET